MKSPKVKGIGEVVTEYGAKVMKIFKKGLLERSLFDFYGDVKANAIRVKESSSVPQTPVDNDGGVVYVKNSDGKLYYKSNEVSEVEISANGGTITTDDTPNEGEVLVYNDSTVVWGHPEKIHLQVRNNEGSTISAGQPLYSKGEIGGSNRILVGVCDANDSAKMPCIGIAHSEMNTTSTKDNFAVVSGIYNTNISGFTSLAVGDNLYIQDNGSLSQTKPTGEASLIQNVAIVLRTNGTICHGMLVSAIGRTNDVPNLNSGYILYGNGSDQAVSTQLSTLLSPDLTVDGAGTVHANNYTDTNTTYSIQDGELSQNNFTDADHSKLNGIESGATADQTNVTGSSGSCTGNAATATALTAGNKTIDGNLTIGANQAGHDFSLHGATTNFSKCMWDASHNQLHFTDQAKIVFGTGGGPGGSDSSIRANGSNLVITNSVGNIQLGDSVEITGNLDVTGNIDLPGIVRSGLTYIKILPRDFIADDIGRPVQINDSSSSRFLVSHSTAKMYASVEIPLGFKATAVDVYGSGTSSMSVYVANINSSSPTSLGNGSIGTTFTISSGVNADTTNYLLIELAQTSLEKVYGGKVTISKI